MKIYKTTKNISIYFCLLGLGLHPLSGVIRKTIIQELDVCILR
jgi:hypothetical protein